MKENAVSPSSHGLRVPPSCTVAVTCSRCQDSTTFVCQVSSQTTEAAVTAADDSNSINNADNNSGTATPKTGDTVPYLMLYIIVLAGCGADRPATETLLLRSVFLSCIVKIKNEMEAFVNIDIFILFDMFVLLLFFTK